MNPDPHRGRPVLMAGAPLGQARAALIMVHGRGGTAKGMLRMRLSAELSPEGFAYLAPQADGNSWYPNRFMTPIHSNEPWLSSALSAIGRVLQQVSAAGIPVERTILFGFSQGACLSLEYVARNAHRYGGVAALSGGLIGPDGTPRDYVGTLGGTPIFLGCSDADNHIPKERVLHSADVLRRLGGDVSERLYPDMGHTINQDELSAVRSMMSSVFAYAP